MLDKLHRRMTTYNLIDPELKPKALKSLKMACDEFLARNLIIGTYGIIIKDDTVLRINIYDEFRRLITVIYWEEI